MSNDDSGIADSRAGIEPAKRATLTLPKKSKIELSDAEKSTGRLRASFANWIGNAPAGFNYAVTLTYPLESAPSSRKDAERVAKRFSLRYNRVFGYGSNSRRKAKHDPTKAAPIFMVNDSIRENGKETNFHHHIALVKPAGMSDADFAAKVDWCWQQCLPGRSGRTDVGKNRTGGWKVYLAGKQRIGDQLPFDVHNTNIY